MQQNENRLKKWFLGKEKAELVKVRGHTTQIMEKSKGPAGPEKQDLRKHQENNNGKGKKLRNDSEE